MAILGHDELGGRPAHAGHKILDLALARNFGHRNVEANQIGQIDGDLEELL